jgi:ATP-binding cassette subfamily B protein/subfamily B ATP-binding cassette protein MsbA
VLSTLLCNLAAACLEGVSFGLLLLAFASLGGVAQDALVLAAYLPGYFAHWSFVELVIGAIALQGVRSAFSYLGQVLTTRLSIRMQMEAEKRIYRQVLSMTLACVGRYKAGDLADYAHTPAKITSLLDSLNRSLVALLHILALTALLCTLSFVLTLFVASIMGGAFLLQKYLVRKVGEVSVCLSKHVAAFSQRTLQTLQSLKVIAAFNRRGYILDAVDRTIAQGGAAAQRLHLLHFSVAPINEVTGILAVAACLMLGPMLLVGEEKQVLPILLTFITVAYRLAARVQMMMAGLANAGFYLGPVLRLQEILNKKDKHYVREGGVSFCGLQHAIEFCSVSLRYSEHLAESVRDLSFVVPRGSMLALVGSSGAGKSSVLDLLLGLYEPTSGSIHIDGVDLRAYDLGALRDACGVVGQETILFHDTIEENIRFGCRHASHQEVLACAQMAGAHAFIMGLSEGYQTIVGERGHILSGGERQRLALARALLRRPQILILDEATSNLDAPSERLIRDAVDQLRNAATVIVVAHRLSTVIRADQILVLENGALVERGTHDALLERNGVYAALWRAQDAAASPLQDAVSINPISIR